MFIPQSFTDIYRMIVKSGHPKVGKDTVQRHLNKLVEQQWLVKLPKEGQNRKYNRTLYIFSPEAFTMIDQYFRREYQKAESRKPSIRSKPRPRPRPRLT